ncbi:MAG: helix-turn-helix domain-containing protein, partial [Clostridia bacterium]|nr:helix-turn-helix domain-containing protein [Clostridia bacterium]
MKIVDLFYPAVFRKNGNEYSVSVPDLPDVKCFGGKTLEDAYTDASIEIGFYFDDFPEDPPGASSYDDINAKISGENEFVMLVPAFNMDYTMSDVKTNAGEYIREGLEKRNLTADEAGEILGVDGKYINEMMSGKSMPSNSMAKRMALLFDFDVERFFDFW